MTKLFSLIARRRVGSQSDLKLSIIGRCVIIAFWFHWYCLAWVSVCVVFAMSGHLCFSRSTTKLTKWHMRPVKTQTSLGFHPVWSESLLCALGIAKDLRFLHADSKGWSDWAYQTGSLRWAHRSFCWFFRAVTRLSLCYMFFCGVRKPLCESKKKKENCFEEHLNPVQNFPSCKLTEPPHDKTNKMPVRPAKAQISLGIRPVWSESSLSISLGNRPVWSVFAVRTKKAWFLSYPLSAKRRFWSDLADAQTDLSLRWAHSHVVGFVMRRLLYWRFLQMTVLRRCFWCLICMVLQLLGLDIISFMLSIVHCFHVCVVCSGLTSLSTIFQSYHDGI